MECLPTAAEYPQGYVILISPVSLLATVPATEMMMITKMHPMHIPSEAQDHQGVQISLRKDNYDISGGRQ